tara:strand:+ start:386 stop:769 length:384 start_codon:yes stop_codon:yes gene_type:complete
MKSNIEKVYSKLPKIELATQKVELGVIQDAKKANSQGDKIVEEARKHLSKIDKLYGQYVSIINKNKNIIKELDNKFSLIDKIKKDVIQASKELGVNPKEISEYIELEDTQENLKNIKTRLGNYPNID